MNREKAFKLIKEKVKNPNLVKHMLAAEAVMRALAKTLNENEDEWGLAGLLHDLDYAETAEDFEKHGKVSAEMLEGQVGKEILHAIKVHAGHESRLSKMDEALYAVDPLTGLIVAAALVTPEKKLSAITKENVLKRFDERRFAAGASRSQIKTCKELGLTLEEFIDIGLKAMQGISKDLGL